MVIELVRKVKIQSPKNTLDEEHVLKSNKFDLNIIGPYNFSQSITSQLLIRTTPPTIRYKDRVLRVHYKIRAKVFTENKKTPNLVLELPIVIGTWPRADIPIDDDDDEDIIQNMGEVMISDDDDDEDIWMRQQEELEFKRHSSSSFASPSPTLPNSTKNHFNNNNSSVRRSGSNNSLGSISSWRSQSTADPRISTATSPTSITNSSVGGSSVISNNTIPENHQRNTLPPVGFKMSNGYLNRSSSTPDLLSNPPLPPQQTGRTILIDPTVRSSYYEPQNGHRSTKSLHSIHPQSQQHRRIGSDEFNFTPTSSSSFSVSHSDPEVPNHTLTFVSSHLQTTTPPRIVTQHKPITESNTSSLDETSDSDSEDDDDSDDDLFAIIEKKKRKEEREQKRRQRIMYTVNE